MSAERHRVMAGVCSSKTQGYGRCLQEDAGLWQEDARLWWVFAGKCKVVVGVFRKTHSLSGCLQEDTELWRTCARKQLQLTVAICRYTEL